MNERYCRFAEAYNDVERHPSLSEVAAALGVAYKTVKNMAGMIRRLRDEGEDVPELVDRTAGASYSVRQAMDVEELPPADEPLDELVERVVRHHDRLSRREKARNIVNVKIKVDGPFGVAGIPDPHLNNPGTDLRRALRDAGIIAQTEGLYCVGIGDWLDNFIMGRLERERRGDIMSHGDAIRIQEHFVCIIIEKIIAAIGGNHNDWPAQLGGEDALARLFNDLGAGSLYHPDEVRVRLNTPSGRSFTHLARHIFPGHSKYNTGHGVLVWLLERWQGEDVAWGGHIHSAAHVSMERNWEGTSRIVHGIQLPSYKKIDGYATKRGFRPNTPFITPMVIHDPQKGVTSFHDDIVQGVDYLKFLRRKARA